MSIFGSMYSPGADPNASSAAAKSSAGTGSRKIDDPAGRTGSGTGLRPVDDLTARCDQLVMVCEAMWTILRDKLGVTDEELVTRVNDIDLSDGKLDGKVRKTAVSCPKCGRTIARRFQKCMYCGQPVVHDPFA